MKKFTIIKNNYLHKKEVVFTEEFGEQVRTTLVPLASTKYEVMVTDTLIIVNGYSMPIEVDCCYKYFWKVLKNKVKVCRLQLLLQKLLYVQNRNEAPDNLADQLLEPIIKFGKHI